MAETRQTTKRERKRAAAEARAAARRRRERRRTLGYALGGIALIAVVVVGVVVLMGSADGEGAGPSASGQVSVSGPPRDQPLGPGDAVPAFTAPAIGGGTVSWDGFAGRPAVIPVWAPWCPHCQVELPVVAQVMAGFPEVAFLTVVTAIGEAPGPDPAAFLSENGITAPTAVDDEAGTLAGAFGIRAFPSLFFVGSDGRVVQMAEGEVAEDALRRAVASLT
jgi:thiol-disulfide isomerase/thioredoxin